MKGIAKGMVAGALALSLVFPPCALAQPLEAAQIRDFAVKEAAVQVQASKVKKVAISKVKVSKIKARAWTGKVIKPNPKVTYKGKTLKKGRDYTLRYRNVSKKYNYYDFELKKRYKGTAEAWGDAQVVITGKGRFRGSRTVKFKLKGPQVGKNIDAQFMYGFNNGYVHMLKGDGSTVYVGYPARHFFADEVLVGPGINKPHSSLAWKLNRCNLPAALPWAYDTTPSLNPNRVQMPKGLAEAWRKMEGFTVKDPAKIDYVAIWPTMFSVAAESPTSLIEYGKTWNLDYDIPLWFSKRLYQIDRKSLAQNYNGIPGAVGNYSSGGFHPVLK